MLFALPAACGLGAFAGLYLALSGGEVRLNPAGFVCVALASGGGAATFILGARVAARVSLLLMTFGVNAVGLVMILPLIPERFALPPGDAGRLALAAATLFCLVAIPGQFQALEPLPAARAAFLLNLETVVSILLAWLVLDELLGLIQWLGVILVISVVALSLRFRPLPA